VKGEDKETINFDDIEESNDGLKVTCKDKVKVTGGVYLPVDAKNFDAVWKEPGGGEAEVKSSAFKWKKGRDATLMLYRKKKDIPMGPMDEDDFKRLVARYKVRQQPRCSPFHSKQTNANVDCLKSSLRRGAALSRTRSMEKTGNKLCSTPLTRATMAVGSTVITRQSQRVEYTFL